MEVGLNEFMDKWRKEVSEKVISKYLMKLPVDPDVALVAYVLGLLLLRKAKVSRELETMIVSVTAVNVVKQDMLIKNFFGKTSNTLSG